MHTFLIVLLMILSAAIIISIMLQPSKSDGITNLLSGGNENYFAKNKTRTYETMLARVTVLSSVLFALVVIGLNIIR